MTDLHPFLAQLADAGAYEPPSRPQTPRNGTHPTPALPGAGDPQAARYAGAALEREAQTVAGTGEGTRNDTLNKAAFRVGQLVGLGWLDQPTATGALVDAGIASGLPYAESERTVISGMDAGMRAPRDGVELYTPAIPAPPAHVVDEAALGGGQVPGRSHGVVSESGEPATDTPPRPRQLIDGGPFIHGAHTHVPALWGVHDEILWAQGEPLIITGPTGVGKTTLGTNVVAGRLGLIPDVLGYPVRPGERRTLVLAMDRPQQIRRAMARLLRQWPENVLNDRLIVWQGPPPMDLGKHPLMLYQLAEMADADTVVIDSLKDAAVKLSDEETGQGLSRAMNYCVTNGVEVLAYHHQKKNASRGDGKPNTISDVYGSHWITAGAGSVLLLWGNPGDLVIELSHLKQPAGEVGPLHIGHDHLAGRTFLYDDEDGRGTLLDLLASGPQTASTVASWLGGEVDRAAVAKARRRLDKLVELGQAVRVDGPAPGRRGPGGQLQGREGGRYQLATPQVSPMHATVHAEARATLDLDVSPGRTVKHAFDAIGDQPEARQPMHADDTFNLNPQVAPKNDRSTPPHAATEARPRPPLKGGGARARAGTRTREGDSMPWDSHDVEVCSRCFEHSDRLALAASGKRLCPQCAYRTENPTEFDNEES